MVKEASVPSTRETFQEDQNLPSMGNVGMKCPKCKEILLVRDWEKNLKVCSRCNYHFRLSAQERIAMLVDAGSFVEQDADIISVDPLSFVAAPTNWPSQISYVKKLEEEQKKTGQNEAVVSGSATIDGKLLALAVMDFRFMGGSMSSAEGEKITLAIEHGCETHNP